MLLFTLLRVAVAQEPVADLPEGITVVPEGSVLQLKTGESLTLQRIPSKYWLLPDAYYREAVVRAKKLEICQPALDSITEEALQMADRTYTVLSKCNDQFDADEDLVTSLTTQVQSLETRALVAESQLKEARKDKWVAWGITGGVVLGATAATAVALTK